MNPLQNSHEDLKELFRGDHIASVNVVSGVMNGITTTRSKRGRKLWLRTGIVMAALLIITMPMGSAVMNWDFFNTRGELTMTLKQSDPDMFTGLEIRDWVREQIEPGKAAVMYIDGQKGLTTLSNPISYANLNDVKARVNVPVKFPTTTPQGFVFKEGEVQFMGATVNYYEMEQVLAKEARANDKGVAFRVIDLTNESMGYRLVFSNDINQEIYVSASFTQSPNGIQSKTIYSDLNSSSGDQKVQIGTNQGLYSRGKDTHKLMWVDVDHDQSIWYTINSPAKNGLTKEDLINLATNMK